MAELKKEVTRLEDLPSETILEELYPLFSLEELYQTFTGLNHRFNDILRSFKRLSFAVTTTNQQQPALIFFKSSVAQLTVQIGQFDIEPFSGLRSLTLKYPSLQQRNAIRPECMPNLEYLSLSYPLEDPILLNLIFSNAFEHLKDCRLDRTVATHSWTGSLQLRSLSISVNNTYGLTCVLRACPNLVRLNIIVYNAPQDDHFRLLKHSISVTNVFLRHLFIRSRFRILFAILTLTPNLRWLSFDDITKGYSSTQNPDFTFPLLADVLFKLKHLSYLHFVIDTTANNANTSLSTLHPIFQHVSNSNGSIVVISGSLACDR